MDEHQKPSILFVEDEADFREIISEHLTAAGYYVVQASNGKEALDILRKNPSPWFALIINVGLLVKTILALGVKFEIMIMASGSVGVEPEAKELSQQGFIRVLPKPYQAKDLLKILVSSKLNLFSGVI
jgi:CheY-like chemotaxis protein